VANAADETWRREAACSGMDVNDFFTNTRADNERQFGTVDGDHDKMNAARHVCRECPVIQWCRADSVNEEFGIFGGLGVVERARLRAKYLKGHPADYLVREVALRRLQRALAAVAAGNDPVIVADRYRVGVEHIVAWFTAPIRKGSTAEKCPAGHPWTDETTGWKHNKKANKKYRYCRRCQNSLWHASKAVAS